VNTYSVVITERTSGEVLLDARVDGMHIASALKKAVEDVSDTLGDMDEGHISIDLSPDLVYDEQGEGSPREKGGGRKKRVK